MKDLRMKINRAKREKLGLKCRYCVVFVLMVIFFNACNNSTYGDAHIPSTSISLETVKEEKMEIDPYQEEIMFANSARKTTDFLSCEKFLFNKTDEADKFVNNMNDWDVCYTYSDLYSANTYLKKYEQVLSFSDFHNEVLEDVTVDGLYNKVLENNYCYVKEKKENVGFCFYKELSNEEIKEICEYVVEAYEGFSKEKEANVEEVKCVLNNLKVFQNASASNAFVNEEYCLVTSPGMIDILQIMNDDSDVDVYKNTIIHEASHLFQLSCPDRISETIKMIGVSPQYDGFNPLNFSWYYEGSAEKCTANLTKKDPLVYQYMINYLESISVATILDDNVRVHQNELNCFTKDLDAVFKMFNCLSEKDKLEIIDLMYSIQIIEVEPEEFFEKLSDDVEDEKKSELKKDLKSSICLTLTKYFYKNLVTKAIGNEVSFEDLFFLITVFENDINSHISYNKLENYAYYEEFMANYSIIQNAFFELLSTESGYSYEDILVIFNEYALYQDIDGGKEYNATLEWIDNEKRRYIMDREDKLNTYSTANIQFVLEKRSITEENVK